MRVIVHGWVPLESIARYEFPGLGDNLALFRETRGPLWRHFMATVISVSRNSNHSSYAHTLILGKQWWDRESMS